MATPPKNDNESAGTASAKARAEREKNTVASDTNDAGADVARLKDDLARLSNDVAALVSAQADVARETARDYATDLYDQGVSAVRSAEVQARQAADDLSRKVQENPLQAVGIAFGIGYLLGFLKRGR